jgi:hypothetical protein
MRHGSACFLWMTAEGRGHAFLSCPMPEQHLASIRWQDQCTANSTSPQTAMVATKMTSEPKAATSLAKKVMDTSSWIKSSELEAQYVSILFSSRSPFKAKKAHSGWSGRKASAIVNRI